MRGVFQEIFRRKKQLQGITFSRPLVIIESDDWGRVGVCDRQGFDQLRARGLRLGEHPYDLYTLETAEDVNELASLLLSHRDCSGRAASLVMNFCVANLDFAKMRLDDYSAIELLGLSKGLPGQWSRPGLFDAYREAIRRAVFYPAMHGVTHFCPTAIENALAGNGERARFLRTLWDADTPYIYWRMPWIGYEYWNPEKPHAGFLPQRQQGSLIQKTFAEFTAFFGTKPVSACAAGYRANHDTHRAWVECGIRVAQNGTGNGLRAPHMDEYGLLHLYRAIDFEPVRKEVETEKYVEVAANCAARGIPIVISTHSINFHSSIKDFRSSTLAALDALLTALESKFPDLLYVNDEELYKLVTDRMIPSGERIQVSGMAPERRLAMQEAL